jgi:hypothetical protein
VTVHLDVQSTDFMLHTGVSTGWMEVGKTEFLLKRTQDKYKQLPCGLPCMASVQSVQESGKGTDSSEESGKSS